MLTIDPPLPQPASDSPSPDSPSPDSPSPDSPNGNSSPESDSSSAAPLLAHYVELITESLPVTILMSLFTIWALFSDDIRLAATTKEADVGFMVVISIAFILFSLELVAGCIYKENYLCLPSLKGSPQETWTQKIQRICSVGGFYFWLDLIATVSLVFEVLCLYLSSVSLSSPLPDPVDHRGLPRHLKPEQPEICSRWKSFPSWSTCGTNREIGSNGEALQILHRHHSS